MSKIELESDAIVVAIGAMATGKSTFLNAKFAPNDIVSSDYTREMVTGHFENMSEDDAVWKIVHNMIDVRAEHGIFTVVDSTGSRSLLEFVRRVSEEHARPLYAFIFPHLTPEEITEERMQHRMKYIHAYYRQVKRIDETDISSRFTPIVIPKIGRDLIEIEFKDSGKQKYYLSDDRDYVVVPDLHGEYRVLEEYIKRHEDDNTGFVFLGDLVDRGASAYFTFRLVERLVHGGRAKIVRGNHDDKLARWFNKWLKDESDKKYIRDGDGPEGIHSYGMKIAHGLSVTLREFFDDLTSSEKDHYAHDFVQFYHNDMLEYLRLETHDTVHFFAHAGINQKLLMGKEPKKSDTADVIYNVLPDKVNTLENMAKFISPDKNIVLHVGHLWEGQNTYLIEKTGRYTMINHDIGLGKWRGINDGLPEFYYIKTKREGDNNNAESREFHTLPEC